MTDFANKNFFRDDSLVVDPYPYFEEIRAQCPVKQEPNHGVSWSRATRRLSRSSRHCHFLFVHSVTGPFPGFPVPLEGDDVSDLIELHRRRASVERPIPTLDPPIHTAHRGLLMRLMTPKRLRKTRT